MTQTSTSPPDASTLATTTKAHTRTHRLKAWTQLLLRPLGVFIPVFILGTFITFLLRDISGLSPAYLQAGENATPELIAEIESSWGLDQPFLNQYFTWFTNLLSRDMVTSWYNGVSIAEQLWDRALITVSIALVALTIGLALGVRSEERRVGKAGGFGW